MINVRFIVTFEKTPKTKIIKSSKDIIGTRDISLGKKEET
jgi:hypothetical protein